MILADKNHVRRKEGIGFMSNTQQKPTIFVKRPTLHVFLENKYNFCGRHNHFAYKCPFKKYSSHKLVWVPKGTMNILMPKIKIGKSNHEDPKLNGYLEQTHHSCRHLYNRKLGAKIIF